MEPLSRRRRLQCLILELAADIIDYRNGMISGHQKKVAKNSETSLTDTSKERTMTGRRRQDADGVFYSTVTRHQSRTSHFQISLILTPSTQPFIWHQTDNCLRKLSRSKLPYHTTQKAQQTACSSTSSLTRRQTCLESPRSTYTCRVTITTT